MNPKMTLAVLLLSVGTLVMGADLTPDQLRDQGFEALKASQSDESKIVDAARLLAQAAEGYEKAGNDDAAAELNAYLYWCKKRMTLAQTEAFARTGESGKNIAQKLDSVASQKVESGEAGKWLERADAFAAAHPNEPLLCAVRYFEVADRFVGAQESLIAQRKSLDLISSIKTGKAKTGSGYLADSEPSFKSVHNGWFSIGKRSIDESIMVNGRERPKSLFMHSPKDPAKRSFVRWELDGKATTFVSRVSLEDVASEKATSPFVFKVIGDGKVIWTSKMITGKASDACRIGVRGVKVLELQVTTLKDGKYGWTIWVDPILE